MQVILHRADRDAEPIRDPLVAESPRDKLRNFALTTRKSDQPWIRYLTVRKGRYPKDDQGIAQIARGLKVNRDAWTDASSECQGEQFLDRQRPLL
jgi:hypothetical protein